MNMLRAQVSLLFQNFLFPDDNSFFRVRVALIQAVSFISCETMVVVSKKNILLACLSIYLFVLLTLLKANRLVYM